MCITVDCPLPCLHLGDPFVAAFAGLVILACSSRACLALTLLFRDFTHAVAVLAALVLAVPGALVLCGA